MFGGYHNHSEESPVEPNLEYLVVGFRSFVTILRPLGLECVPIFFWCLGWQGEPVSTLLCHCPLNVNLWPMWLVEPH